MQQPSVRLNPKVFFPPLVFLVLTIVLSLLNPSLFIKVVGGINQWILKYFGWLFTWSSFLFLILLAVIYFSPLGKVKFGGKNAKPILTKWRWFTIALCTTIATGILFWGCAEPLYHYHSPPEGLGIAKASPQALQFSLSTMFMHWSITPYGIYTVAGLMFALVYYNLRQPFSIGALLYPVFNRSLNKGASNFVDVLCLYSLVLGMSASLGSGILAMMGGLEINLGWQQSSLLQGGIAFTVVATFIISAASGLHKGIKTLSNINTILFIGLAVFVLIFGPTAAIFKQAASGLYDYVLTFIPRSTNIGSGLNNDWLNDWTIFYWANWFAWAPIASLFLGRLAKGYTVRDFIHFNCLLPSLFAILWMAIFSGTTLHFDTIGGGVLNELMQQSGEENVMYAVLSKLRLGATVSLFTLLMVFISYVTAADSNISAMGGISTEGIAPDKPEAPIWIKVVWGIIIGLVAWIMLSTAGIDGIRMLSVLGGFPALFIIILVAFGFVRLLINGSIIKA